MTEALPSMEFNAEDRQAERDARVSAELRRLGAVIESLIQADGVTSLRIKEGLDEFDNHLTIAKTPASSPTGFAYIAECRYEQTGPENLSRYAWHPVVPENRDLQVGRIEFNDPEVSAKEWSGFDEIDPLEISWIVDTLADQGLADE